MAQKYGIAIDYRRCIGCGSCSVSCKLENNLPNDVWYCTVNTVGGASKDCPGGSYGANTIAYQPLRCQHCENPACVAVCPTSALVPMDPMPDDLAGAVAETTNAADGLTVIACARKAARNVGDPDKYAVVPCLARMEEELLVELVARGVPEICLVDGDCRTCKYRGAVPAIDDTVESTRALIEAMGSDAQITRTSEFPASVQVEDMR